MSDSDSSATPQETFAAAARRSSFGTVKPGETPSGHDVLLAIGGVRGLVESIAPGVTFLVVYTITRELLPAVLIPFGIAVIFVVMRIIGRSPFTSALAGVIGLGISAGLALLTGRPEDNFVPGFVINAVSLVALLLSLAIRLPLIGVIASLITGSGTSWREDPAKRRVSTLATMMWCGLFALRLGVELPLYFAQNIDALAALKLLLGVPLYAAMLWVTWLLLRAAYQAPRAAESSTAIDET